MPKLLLFIVKATALRPINKYIVAQFENFVLNVVIREEVELNLHVAKKTAASVISMRVISSYLSLFFIVSNF